MSMAPPASPVGAEEEEAGDSRDCTSEGEGGRVFSRDNLKGGSIGVQAGGRGVLGVYYLLENIIPTRKYPAVIVSSKF